jgi:hypothetical protein
LGWDPSIRCPRLGYGSPGTSFGGNYFSHAIVAGAATSLIEDLYGNVLLAEMQVGSGLAIFGGMTTTNWHNPSPGATHLRENILAYGAANVVPEPGTATLLGLGIAGLAVVRKRS